MRCILQESRAALGPLADRCKHHNRFMRIHSNGNMDGSGRKGKDELPSDWTWERFSVVVVQKPGPPPPPAENPFKPGAVVAMHSKIHNRFIRHR